MTSIDTCIALPVALNSSVKRRYSPETYSDNDSENVDPNLFSSKKSKNLDGLPIKASKPSAFVLKASNSTPAMTPRKIMTPKRLSLSTTAKPAPYSAPAGRSPKSKRSGALSRRRISASPFTRVDPPSFGQSSSLPFSIDAALSGTIPSYTPLSTKSATPAAPTLAVDVSSMPRSWQFEIHEDTPDEELGNMMEFSTQTLDISDDESKVLERADKGKENIPPELIGAPALATAHISRITRKDLMTDEARTPLGDLDASEYYAEGCNADSFFVVDEDAKPSHISTAVEEQISCQPTLEPAQEATDIGPAPSPCEAPNGNQDLWREILASVEAKAKASAAALAATENPTTTTTTEATAVYDENGIVKCDGPIEIWESESAKGDAEEAEKVEAATI